MNLIQELLAILERKETVKTLIPNRDWFEIGRIQSSTLSTPSYTPKMHPHAIRFDDLLAQIISNIPGSSITLTTTGSSGPATFVNNVLNIPQYASTITLTTTGTSGAATFLNNALNIPQYQGVITLTTTGTSGPATFANNVLNIPQYAGLAYTAGTGLSLTGTVFSLSPINPATGSGTNYLPNGGTFTYYDTLQVNTFGQITSYGTRTSNLPTLIAGTGITLTPNFNASSVSTITISAAAATPVNAWYNIAVDNGSATGTNASLVPDSTQDTLTFAGATGINVTTLDTGGTLDRVVIENTGVISVGGSSGVITLGSGLSISGNVLSATGVSSPNAWYNIAVANGSSAGGSSTIVPDAVQDTLTFAGGTGIEVSTLDTGGTLDRVVIRNTGVTSFAGATGAISIGSGLSFSGGTLTATGGSGTVTSVGLTMPTGFNVSGSPITTSGAFNVTLALSNGVVGVCNGELSILNLSGLTFNNSTCTLTADPAPIQSIIAGTGITVTPGPNVTVSSSVVSCLDNKYDTYNMVIAKGNDPTIVSLTGVALGFKATVANLEYNLVLTLSYQGINDGSGSFPAETNASIPVRFMKSTTSGTLLPPSFGNFTELVKWDDYFLVPAADSARSATRTYSWTVKNLPLNEAVSIWVGGSPAFAGPGAISVTKANLSITVAACEAYGTNIGTITTQ